MTRQELLENAKPILFNTEMVRAILDGKKSVTRRVLKPQPSSDGINTNGADYGVIYNKSDVVANSHYKIGDILYVRETATLQYIDTSDNKARMFFKADKSFKTFEVTRKEIIRLSKYTNINQEWLSPYWLTKETARIFLRVTNVRVERLQDITDVEAGMEGISELPYGNIDEFINLWNGTIKKQDIDTYGWNANPWVWVYEFERVIVDEN